MGTMLKSFYEKAEKLGGMKAHMRLTMLTQTTIIRAEDEPDTEENIRRYNEALAEIEKEFKKN